MSLVTAKDIVQGDAEYKRVLNLWRSLTDGPWIVRDPGPTYDHSLLLEIDGLVRPNAPIRQPALMSGVLSGLVHQGFIRVRRLENGRTEYTKASEPPPPDTRTWVERENEALARLQRQERAILDREFEARQRAAQTLNAPFEAAERAKVLRALRELGYPTPDEIKALVRAEVGQQLELAADDAAHTTADYAA